jgi:hypothetical protein
MVQAGPAAEAQHDDSKLPLDKLTFGVAAALVLTFLVWGRSTRTA